MFHLCGGNSHSFIQDNPVFFGTEFFVLCIQVFQGHTDWRSCSCVCDLFDSVLVLPPFVGPSAIKGQNQNLIFGVNNSDCKDSNQNSESNFNTISQMTDTLVCAFR